MAKSALYLSHDGILEPLGESQVLAYLERISSKYSVHLISFEKARDWSDTSRVSVMKLRLEKAGIHWHPLRYHSKPPLLSTLFDLWRGYFLAKSLHREFHFFLTHSRSYPMALLALQLRKKLGVPFIFDMRGFWADERVESGGWSKKGFLYRIFKNVEKNALLNSAAVVSLTEAAVNEMKTFSYLQGVKRRFQVIPTCADLSLFHASAVPGKPFTLGYVGSTALWYDFAPMALVFRELRALRPEARLVVLTRDPQEPIRKILSEFPEGSFEIRSASRKETAEAIAKMHFTAFFLKSSYAKKASMPTKLAEFLGSGVPCLTNVGCGDLEAFFTRNAAGAAVKDPYDVNEISHAVRELVTLSESEAARKRCRSIAEAELGLDAGAASYLKLYSELEHG